MLEVIIVENVTRAEMAACLERAIPRRPELRAYLDTYIRRDHFPRSMHFRLFKPPIEEAPLTYFIVCAKAGAEPARYVAFAEALCMTWDGSFDDLPYGWSGSIRRCYENARANVRANTFVPCALVVEAGQQGKGLARDLIQTAKAYASFSGFQYCVLPLLPPTRVQSKELAAMNAAGFSALKRADGLPSDHWIRLHASLGAQVLGTKRGSHRFAFSLEDFARFACSTEVRETGHHVVFLDKLGGIFRGWQRIYVNVEEDVVLFDRECVWISYATGGGTSSADFPLRRVFLKE